MWRNQKPVIYFVDKVINNEDREYLHCGLCISTLKELKQHKEIYYLQLYQAWMIQQH